MWWGGLAWRCSCQLGGRHELILICAVRVGFFLHQPAKYYLGHVKLDDCCLIRKGTWLSDHACAYVLYSASLQSALGGHTSIWWNATTPCARAREICVQKLGNVYHWKETFSKITCLFANDTHFPFTIFTLSSVNACLVYCLRHVEVKYCFMCKLYSVSWFCIQQDFYVWCTQEFELTQPLSALLGQRREPEPTPKNNLLLKKKTVGWTEKGAFKRVDKIWVICPISDKKCLKMIPFGVEQTYMGHMLRAYTPWL